MSRSDAAYRAQRKVEGRAIVDRRPKNAQRAATREAVRVIFWDGEGHTIARTGIAPHEWTAETRALAQQMLDDANAVQLRYWNALDDAGGKLRAPIIGGGYASIYADVPRSLLARGRENVDDVADAAGVPVDDLLDFFALHHRPPTFTTMLRRAKEELEPALERHTSHRYVILANNVGTAIVDPSGISTARCLDALCNTATTYPKAVHTMYGGSYDVTMMLRDLTRDDSEAVIRNTTKRGVEAMIDGRLYSFAYRARKYLKIGRFAKGDRKFIYGADGWRPNYDAYLTLWETFGYFGVSFVEALRKNNITADLDAMAAMKAARSTFDADGLDAQLRYCQTECAAGAALIVDLRRNLSAAGMLTARMDGPGAIASTVFQRKGVKAHIEPEPEWLRRPFAQSYFGGRIESTGLGVTERLYANDVVSAYPYHLRDLPSLRGGRWVRETDVTTNALVIVKATWYYKRGAAPFYPLPFRIADGSVKFPREGRGWYYAVEVAAAIAHAQRFGGTVWVEDGWTFEPATDERPFAWVQEFFDLRAEWKAAGNGAQIAIRLALNSCYGKLASQLGGTPDERPPYFSFIYAGAITSGCRAQMLRLALSNPEAVALFATDGLYSTAPMDAAPVLDHLGRPRLGSWDAEQYARSVIVQPGVYWLADSVDGTSWKARFRGFDRESMQSPRFVLDAWNENRHESFVPSSRFITTKQALVRGDFAARGTWEETPRRLRLDGGGKRSKLHDVAPCSTQFVPTSPAELPPLGDEEESQPYDSLLWADREERDYWKEHEAL